MADDEAVDEAVHSALDIAVADVAEDVVVAVASKQLSPGVYRKGENKICLLQKALPLQKSFILLTIISKSTIRHARAVQVLQYISILHMKVIVIEKCFFSDFNLGKVGPFGTTSLPLSVARIH